MNTMEEGTLYIVLTLCTLGYGSELIPMCSPGKTNLSDFPVLLYMEGDANSSSPACSCELQSDTGFYVTLMRFRPARSPRSGSFIINMTTMPMFNMTNMPNTIMPTYGLDLSTMHTDVGGSDCLLMLGDNTRLLTTQTSCLRNLPATGNITLQTPNNLSHGGYLYLRVYGDGSIQFDCQPTQFSQSNNFEMLDSRTNTTVGITASPAGAAARAGERQVMTAAIVILGTGWGVLGMAMCWLRHRNKQLSEKRQKRAWRKISTHTDWQPEAESHYEEMDEDLTKTGNTHSTSENVKQLESEAYELAKAPVPLCGPCNKVIDQDSSLYDVATALNTVSKFVAPSGNAENNDGAYYTCKPNGQHVHMASDSIYDKTVFTADSNTYVPAADNDDNVPVSDYGDDQSLTSAVPTRSDASNAQPSVSDTNPKKSLDKTTSHSALRLVRQKSVEVRSLESCDSGPEDGMDSPGADKQVLRFMNAACNSTPEVCEEEFENVSSQNHFLDREDEEIYVNQVAGRGFCSGEGKPLEDSRSVSPTLDDLLCASLLTPNTKADDQSITLSPSKSQPDNIRKNESPSRLRTDNQLSSLPVSCVPENPVFHNVHPATSTGSLSSGASQASDDDDMIYQNVDLEKTNSIASLLHITSDPEKPYENLKRGQPYVPDTKTPASHNKSDEVVVVFLPGPDSNHTEQESEAISKIRPTKIGHKHSFSVDETSQIPRPSRRHRTHSDDTDLLISPNSSSDEDVLEMVNNNLYEGVNNNPRATPIEEPAGETVIPQTRPVPLKQLGGPAASVRSSSENSGDDSEDEMVVMENDIYECLKGGVSIFPTPLTTQIRMKVECTNPKTSSDDNEMFAKETP